jgi:aspartyl/asparaginyl-tRNA synthetase
MAEYISVSKISNYVEKEVTIKGWVYNRTDKGKLVFLLVRDGTGFIQCVAFKGDLAPEVFDRVIRLPQESSVIITGAVREDKRAPGIPGGYEIGVKQIEIVQEAGLDVCLLWPTDVSRKRGELGVGHMIGTGTTYEDRFWHAFEVRKDASVFLNKCKNLLCP